jgi:hypothetical protein
MGMEKILNSSLSFGRKTASYLANDPAGSVSFLAGYEVLEASPIASIPFFAFSIWHIPYTFQMRKKLNKEVKEKGLNELTINKFNRSSWCSHRVTVAYTFGQGEYKKFQMLLNKYSYNHYAKKLTGYIKNDMHNLYNKTKNIVL